MTITGRAAAILLLVAAATAGCAESAAETPSAEATTAPATRWQEPSRYTYVLESTCGERLLIGRFRITVENGKVTKAEGLDDAGARALQGKSEGPPTVGQLLAELDRAREADAHVADLTTDPTDGHPTKITIDPAKNTIDDESCYAITELRT